MIVEFRFLNFKNSRAKDRRVVNKFVIRSFLVFAEI